MQNTKPFSFTVRFTQTVVLMHFRFNVHGSAGSVRTEALGRFRRTFFKAARMIPEAQARAGGLLNEKFSSREAPDFQGFKFTPITQYPRDPSHGPSTDPSRL
jgi:hypothetical protein